VTEIQQNMLNARFELWFEQEMPRLYRYLCYQTRDQAVAEELTASVCEKALARVGQYDPARGELRAWMFGIARNELRAWFRTLKTAPVELPLDCLPEASFPADTPEQELQRRETLALVMRSLDGLAEREREAIALRYGGGLSVAETASILGVTENNAGVMLHRAIAKLRKSLEEVRDGIQS
jgi:RNA polymerase sigma-70 factor (ECF subfamily)